MIGYMSYHILARSEALVYLKDLNMDWIPDTQSSIPWVIQFVMVSLSCFAFLLFVAIVGKIWYDTVNGIGNFLHPPKMKKPINRLTNKPYGDPAEFDNPSYVPPKWLQDKIDQQNSPDKYKEQ
jgi:hypothetical protein